MNFPNLPRNEAAAAARKVGRWIVSVLPCRRQVPVARHELSRRPTVCSINDKVILLARREMTTDVGQFADNFRPRVDGKNRSGGCKRVPTRRTHVSINIPQCGGEKAAKKNRARRVTIWLKKLRITEARRFAGSCVIKARAG